MVCQYDLYDISYAFCIIRSDVRYDLCGRILLEITNALKNENVYEDNQIRRAIASVENISGKQWDFVYHNNVYVNFKLLKDKHIYDLITKICEELIVLFNSNAFERFYDLIDAVHCLPEIIADNKFSVPDDYWDNYIVPYRNKWDKQFLVQEQRCLQIKI